MLGGFRPRIGEGVVLCGFRPRIGEAVLGCAVLDLE